MSQVRPQALYFVLFQTFADPRHHQGIRKYSTVQDYIFIFPDDAVDRHKFKIKQNTVAYDLIDPTDATEGQLQTSYYDNKKLVILLKWS